MQRSPGIEGSGSADKSEGIANVEEARDTTKDDTLQHETTQNDDDAPTSASAGASDLWETHNRVILEDFSDTFRRQLHKSELLVLEQAQINAQFLDAARDGNLETLLDIQDKANSDAMNNSWETALHLACRYGHVDIVNTLLNHESHRKSIKELDDDGWTPLISACSENRDGTLEILRALFKHCQSDININAKTNRGKTALHYARQYSSAEVIGFLLEQKGIDAVAQDGNDNTPLSFASQYGTVEMVKKILDYEPHEPKYWEQKNNEDKNALTSAMFNEKAREEIIPLLLNRGLCLTRKDALELFSRETSKTVSGSHLKSMWLKIVGNMLESNSPPDQDLRQTLNPIMEFSSNEEKVFAILNADTVEHFQILSRLSKDLRLSEEVCQMIWLGRHDPKGKLVSLRKLDLVKEMILSREEWSKPKSDLVPKSPLQWSAFYGEYQLVWCLLKEMQSRDNGDVRKALDIANARKVARKTKGRKGTVPTDNEKENRMDSKQSGRAKDSEKSSVDKEIRRYEYTIDILNNATSLVRITKKQLILADPSDIKGMEDILQQSTATVVSLYERDGQIDILRSTSNIYELIYANNGKGVNAVMEKARSTVEGMTKNGQSNGESKDKLQLRWIHLPANNMEWMEQLTLRIHKENQKDNKKLASFMDLAQRSRNELPTDKSDVKFMKPICLREDDGALVEDDLKGSEGKLHHKTAVGGPRLALYTPYVTFGYCYYEAAKAESKNHKELSELYTKSILHGPRSLDRFYYNALSQHEMDKRDQSQVVTRGLLNLKMGDPFPKVLQKWPYLTVDQLWVWVIDEKTIITSSTHCKNDSDTLLIEKVCVDVLQDSKDGFREKLPSTVTEMSHFLVSTCVDFINNLRWEDVCGENDEKLPRGVKDAGLKPILLWYADSINAVAVKEKELFDSFMEHTAQAKDESGRAIAAAKEKEGRDTTTPPVDGPNSRLRHLKKDKDDWEAIHNAAKLLDEVKDIRDELVILRFLVTQQERVWVGLMGTDLDKDDARSPYFTGHELDAMIKIADTIQNSIKDLVNLDLVDKSAEQSQALVGLAKKADDQSKENARQGKILYAFGFVTVVFTPLSFLSSLLAINTTVSQHDEGGELVYEPVLMYGIIFGVSAIIVFPFLGYAFFAKIPALFRKIHKFSHQMKDALRLMAFVLWWLWNHTDFRGIWNATSAGQESRPNSRRIQDVEALLPAGNSTSEPSSTQPIPLQAL